MDLRKITEGIIGSGMRIHRGVGPGLFESVYKVLLIDDLLSKGFTVEAEKVLPVTFGGRTLDKAFRVDLIVNYAVIVEVKMVTQLAPIHSTQVLTYLRLANMRVGLLLNFGTPSLGIKRIANNA